MKILILGGSGFVGSSIIEYQQDEHTLYFTFNKNSFKNKKQNSIKISFPEDFTSLLDFIKNNQIDIIINTISHTGVDFCEANKEKVYDVNVKLVEKISQACSKLHIKIIQISSDYVFDGVKGHYKESDIPNPINYYGKTKFLAEKILLHNPENTIIRTSHLYGYSEKDRFVNLITATLSNNQKFFAYDDIFSSPTFMDDLVDSIFCIIEKKLTGIFHVTGPTCLGRYEFAKRISHKFNLNEDLVIPISIKSANLLAQRPENTCLDCSNTKKNLNMNFTDIDDALDKIFRFINTDN